MTDRELKKYLKKIGIGLVIMMVLIVTLSVYTLGFGKATLSIYDNTEYENGLESYGINEEEFKQYLSMYGNLVDEEASDDIKTIRMATYFIDQMCSSYEATSNDNGLKCYDADIINEIVKETKEDYRKKELSVDECYQYNKEQNLYMQNIVPDEIPYCIEIEDIDKNGEKIEVTYKLAFLTNSQMAKYLTDGEVSFEMHTVHAIVVQNHNYQYAKYLIESIQKQ